MSWSIDSNTSITELDKALTAAEEANIIMFCASIDRGPTVTDQTYPGRNKNCIKIGASTAKGNRLTWVSKEDSDFLAPGEGIQPAETHLWSQQSEPFGSSVSTALAAGLAGVLLYCDRLLLEKPKAGERYKEPVDLLRLKGNMQKVFSNIAKGESLFLEVTDYFPQKVGRDKWEDKIGHDMTWSYRDKEGTTKTKQVIQDLMTVVKHKIPVTAAS